MIHYIQLESFVHFSNIKFANIYLVHNIIHYVLNPLVMIWYIMVTKVFAEA